MGWIDVAGCFYKYTTVPKGADNYLFIARYTHCSRADHFSRWALSQGMLSQPTQELLPLSISASKPGAHLHHRPHKNRSLPHRGDWSHVFFPFAMSLGISISTRGCGEATSLPHVRNPPIFQALCIVLCRASALLPACYSGLQPEEIFHLGAGWGHSGIHSISLPVPKGSQRICVWIDPYLDQNIPVKHQGGGTLDKSSHEP